MIKEFLPLDGARDSAIFYRSNLEQIIEFFNEIGPEEAGELAISVIELGITGHISSDNKFIRAALFQYKAQLEKNRERYDAKVIMKREYEIEDKKYREIADLYNQGLSYQEIGNRLGIARQTVSNRIMKMKVEYPDLFSDVRNVRNVRNVSFDSSNNSNNVSDVRKIEEEKNLTCQTNVSKVITVSPNVNDNDNVNDNENDNENDNGNVNGKENEKVASSTSSNKANSELTAQQPTTMPIPEHLTLTDWRAQVGELCKSLADWEQDLLRAELTKLPLDKQNSPCWVYCALKKMKATPGRIKDNAYRLNYAPFQAEVDEMVDAERAALEARIRQQNEIENSVSPNMPKRQMIIVPRMEKERPKEIYNIEDF